MYVKQIGSHYVYWLKWPTWRQERAEGLSLVHPEHLKSFTGLRHCTVHTCRRIPCWKKRAVFQFSVQLLKWYVRVVRIVLLICRETTKEISRGTEFYRNEMYGTSVPREIRILTHLHNSRGYRTEFESNSRKMRITLHSAQEFCLIHSWVVYHAVPVKAT